MSRSPALAARRVRQTFGFANGPRLLADLGTALTPWRREELRFRTRSGLTIACPNHAGARVPVYVVFAEDTYRLDERDTVEWVLESLDQLVLKPVDGSGGKGIVIGPRADEKTLAELAVTVRATPRDWIAQKPIGLSTCPTLIGGRIAPRHVDLRPFVLSGADGVRIVPGGLTRVALKEGSLVVNSSQGGGTKDTWIVDDLEGSA